MHSPQAKLQSNLRKLGILPQISIFPSSIYAFLTSTPGNLDLRLFLDGLPAFSGVVFPIQFKTSPQESPIQFPKKVGIHLPKQKAYPQ